MGLVKQQPVQHWKGHDFHQYWLVIQPDAEVRTRIMVEKQHLSAVYGLHSALQVAANIIVAQFSAREGMEETLSRWMQRICCQQRSFMVTLNNYSGFPPHTIYLRVQDYWPFQQLVQQFRPVDEYIQSSACPPATLINKPFLSIAGKLPQQVYAEAMPDYSHRLFHESFMVQELLLLKRDHPADACKTVNVFRLLPGGHRLYTEMA